MQTQIKIKAIIFESKKKVIEIKNFLANRPTLGEADVIKLKAKISELEVFISEFQRFV